MIRTPLLATALSLALLGCGGSDAPKIAAGMGDDYKVTLSTSSVKAGNLKIVANNAGSLEHEIVVVNMPLKDMPLKPDGSVDEDKITEDVKRGEIEHVKGLSKKTGTFDLKPGTYSLFCNLESKLSDGTMVLHYPKGMRAELIVT